MAARKRRTPAKPRTRTRTITKYRTRRASGGGKGVTGYVIPAVVITIGTRLLNQLLDKTLSSYLSADMLKFKSLIISFLVFKLAEKFAPSYREIAKILLAVQLAEVGTEKLGFAGTTVRSVNNGFLSGYTPRVVNFPKYAGVGNGFSKMDTLRNQFPVYR